MSLPAQHPGIVAARIPAGVLGQPGVVCAGVVDDGVQHQPHAARAGGPAQFHERLIAAQQNIDLEIVDGVVAVVAAAREHRVQVQGADAELVLQVGQFLREARQVAAVEGAGGAHGIDRGTPFGGAAVRGRRAAAAAGKAVGKDLVVDLVAHPGRRLRVGVDAKVHRLGRRQRMFAVGRQPAVTARVGHDEGIQREWVAAIPRHFGAPTLQRAVITLRAVGAHGREQLFVVGQRAHEDAARRRSAGRRQQHELQAVARGDAPGGDGWVDHGGCSRWLGG